MNCAVGRRKILLLLHRSITRDKTIISTSTVSLLPRSTFQAGKDLYYSCSWPGLQILIAILAAHRFPPPRGLRAGLSAVNLPSPDLIYIAANRKFRPYTLDVGCWGVLHGTLGDSKSLPWRVTFSPSKQIHAMDSTKIRTFYTISVSNPSRPSATDSPDARSTPSNP